MGEPDRAWRVIRLHHVAFAHAGDGAHGGDGAPDVLTGLLGLPCVHEEAAPGFIERMIPAGEAYLQLLEATGPGIIERFLDRRGPGLHHAAFEVSDIDEAVADLRSRGVRMVDETPRPGGMGTRIAFVHPAACRGLLLELVESPAARATGTDDQMVERS